MKLLTIEELLNLQALLIHKYGGSTDGVRDIGRLESTVATQTQAVFGTVLYITVHEKAAAIMRGIIVDHPFFDGNKRTGMLSALTFLEMNDYVFFAEKGEVEDFAVKVATDHLGVEEIANWLAAHTTRG